MTYDECGEICRNMLKGKYCLLFKDEITGGFVLRTGSPRKIVDYEIRQDATPEQVRLILEAS